MITAEIKINKLSHQLKQLFENCEDSENISYNAKNKTISITMPTYTDLYGIVNFFGMLTGIGNRCEIQEMHIDYFREIP